MNKIKKINFTLLLLVFFSFLVTCRVYAEIENVELVNSSDAEIELGDNGVRDGKRELVVYLNNIRSGRRITDIKYCEVTKGCDNEENWTSTRDYDQSGNPITEFSRGVGNDDMAFWVKVPDENVKLRVDFTNFEPMNITYSKYNNKERYSGTELFDLANYDKEFKNLITGYIGGDIVLPSDCTSNGCILKVTLTKENYNKYNARLSNYNKNLNMDNEYVKFLELSTSFNHLPDEFFIPADTAEIKMTNDDKYYTVEDENTISFFVVINKYFYVNNRTDFTVAGNKNRILSEDYIGLSYDYDRKYFPEGNDYGFLTFSNYNKYNSSLTLFYGTPKVQLRVDKINEILLAEGGNKTGIGTIKNVYNKIVSSNNTKYPVDENFVLTIKSFYEPEYIVPLTLKNDGTTVKDITLNLSRFAFGGNAGGLLLVDGDGKNCRQSWTNPNCNVNNTYVSTSYRGLINIFYSNGETESKNAFEMATIDNQVQGRFINGDILYKRNESFNPWAVAIFYNDDVVVKTKSFNLGNLVKLEGFTTDIIPNDLINNKVRKEHSNELITNYNSSDYTLFGYGSGFEKPVNTIKYFSRNMYEDGSIDYPLLLASKIELLNNNINRIALFLTNGELKPDDKVFPELTYGVGEGKLFEVDDRTFDEGGY